MELECARSNGAHEHTIIPNPCYLSFAQDNATVEIMGLGASE